MTDKELLELAAKAVRLEYWLVRFAPKSAPVEKLHVTRNGETVEWNPIADDGDALRLAVKLGLNLNFNHDIDHVTVDYQFQEQPYTVLAEPYNDDPYASTRRAIVRAAAEIGKAMK